MNSLADKIDKLFEVMHRASEPMISNAAAAEGITRRRSVSISHDDIRQLRARTKRDATVQQLSAIADFSVSRRATWSMVTQWWTHN